MSEPLVKSTHDEPLLLGRDRVLYWVGIGSLCLSGCALALLLLVFFGKFYADFLTFDGALAAAGAVLGSLATTFAAIGSALLFVVSLRVQARELRHSIDELKNSVRAQQEAADNHRQAVTIAEQQLITAKQEKEFNVCLRAVHDAREEFQQFTHGGLFGTAALAQVMDLWAHALSDRKLSLSKGNPIPPFSMMRNIDAVFVRFSSVDAIFIHLYWSYHSIMQKDLAEDDRQYLRGIVIPIISRTGDAFSRLAAILDTFTSLLEQDDSSLAAKGVVRDALKYYQKQFLLMHGRKVLKKTLEPHQS